MVDVKGLTKKYGKLVANDNSSFHLGKGAMGVLLGPNCAGKSTLIKSICGLLRFKGQITIDGHDNRSIKAKRNLGLVCECRRNKQPETLEKFTSPFLKKANLNRLNKMNSLIYLLYYTTKNCVKEILKSPCKLIMYLSSIGFLIYFVISLLSVEMPDFDGTCTETNTLLLKGIFFGFFMLVFFTIFLAGLKETSQYGIEDANFLFVSPIKARTILLYGII